MKDLKNWLILLASLCFFTAAQAATSQNEEEDSVTIWGPWETLGTAAGPGEQIRAISFRYGDNPNFTDNDDFVSDLPDNERFYGIIRPGRYQQEGPCFDCARIASIYFFSENERIVSADISYSSSGISFDFTGEDGLSHSDEFSLHTTRGSDPFMRYRYGERWRGTNCRGDNCARIKELGEDYFRGFTQTAEMMEYIRGEGNGFYGYDYTTSTFIAGTTSSLSAINNLQSLVGDTTAHYSGNLFNSYGGVNMHINLTNATWEGHFYTPIGHAYVESGTINGADLAGSVSSAYDKGNLSGSVEASFFGAQAETIGGVIEAENQLQILQNGLNDNGPSATMKYVDVFKADLCNDCDT